MQLNDNGETTVPLSNLGKAMSSWVSEKSSLKEYQSLSV
jgi:hypothetical protein